ncbi:MAG: L-threonylcarbamoyladenylate synthase [bacterium]|nr:L-threonylcarbamoyladenylate synthase [bacterium]
MTGVASSQIPRNDAAVLRIAVAHLRAGGLLVYPTETSYAIGCDATNGVAVRAVFRVKERVAEKSFPLIVSSRAMAKRYVQWNTHVERLARQHWPGPLTLVLKMRNGPSPAGRRELEGVGHGVLASGMIASNGTVAFRVSSHPIARALARRLGRPLVSTSANRAGEPPCFTVLQAQQFLVHTPSREAVLFLDGGDLPEHIPSTIVDCTGGAPVVIRHGAVLL